MATTKKMINKNICDETYFELSDVKDRIIELRDSLGRNFGHDRKILDVYERHLTELADQIDWKLQIMSHSCSYNWLGSDAEEFMENTVSVGPPEKFGEDFSPGYVGG